MITITDILYQADGFIEQIIKKEMIAQGHHLTGKMEESLHGEVSHKPNKHILEGFAIYYTQFVNEGFPASSANFKQVPYVLAFWKSRGLSDKEALGAAFATIKVWMNQGMPTQASKRFSSTGSRTNMIENALIGHASQIDDFIGAGLDQVIEAEFQLEKSETI